LQADACLAITVDMQSSTCYIRGNLWSLVLARWLSEL